MLPRVIAPDYVKCVATSRSMPIGMHAAESSTVIAFSDGSILAVNAEDPESTRVHRLDIAEPAVLASCSTNGSMWAFAHSGRVAVFEWREEQPTRLGEITLDCTLVHDFRCRRPALLAVSPEGDVLAVDDDSGSASLYRLSERPLLLSESRVVGGAFVASRRQIALLGDDEVVRVVDTDGSECGRFRAAGSGCERGAALMEFVESREAMAISREIEEYGDAFQSMSLATGRLEEMGSYTPYALDDRSGRHMTPTPWRDGWVTIDSAGRIDIQPGTLQVRLPHENVAMARLLPSGNHVVYVPWNRRTGDDTEPHTVWVAGLRTAMDYARLLERGALDEARELDVRFEKRRERERVCKRCGWIAFEEESAVVVCRCDRS